MYDPKTFNSHKILTAISFAALTYIGFDGVTTLAEDVENPKRNVLLAVVSDLHFCRRVQRLSKLIWARACGPTGDRFRISKLPSWISAAESAALLLFNAMGAILIIAAFGSGLTGTLGAARLALRHGTRRRAAEEVLRIPQARQQHSDLQHSV